MDGPVTALNLKVISASLPACRLMAVPPLSSLPSHSGSGGGPPREIGFVSFPSDAAAAAPASA